MGMIKQLPLHLVNKISAGECIERPASVVKELVENALDAGAKRIDVYIEQGGTRLIRVVDNGTGILPDDLPLAIKPHATSKIQDENDLYAIGTMGFRGEALASIASVAILKISSVAQGQTEGASIEIRGGTECPVIPYAGAHGTVVEVHNLFFNTPARRKFLKTANTEMNHCQEAIIKLALPRENIAFTLYHNNRKIIEVGPTESKRQRIADLLGVEIADTLVQVFTQKNGITFTGYVCKPEFARASNRWQYLFVNNRAVRDKFISHALKEAYRGFMPHDRYPIGFLFLDVDPAIVDVNVHPTKSEVRFADSGYVHSLVLGAIRQRFLASDLTATLDISCDSGQPEISTHEIFDRNSMKTTERHISQENDNRPNAADAELKHQDRNQSIKEALTDFLKGSASSGQLNIEFKPAQSPSAQNQDINTQRKETEKQHLQEMPDQTEYKDKPKALQIHNSYLVVETENGLMIIDQHAQHERILYQQLREKVNSDAIAKQKLLIPDVIDLTPKQMAQIEQLREQLDRAGVEIEPFGPRSIAVNSVPAMSRSLNIPEFIEDLLDRTENITQANPEIILEHVLQSLACKAAVKAGQQLKPEEIEALLEMRDAIDMNSACPHGRPTALKMSLSELEKQFKRT